MRACAPCLYHYQEGRATGSESLLKTGVRAQGGRVSHCGTRHYPPHTEIGSPDRGYPRASPLCVNNAQHGTRHTPGKDHTGSRPSGSQSGRVSGTQRPVHVVRVTTSPWTHGRRTVERWGLVRLALEPGPDSVPLCARVSVPRERRVRGLADRPHTYPQWSQEPRPCTGHAHGVRSDNQKNSACGHARARVVPRVTPLACATLAARGPLTALRVGATRHVLTLHQAVRLGSLTRRAPSRIRRGRRSVGSR